MINVDRRSFLKTAGLAGLGLAGLLIPINLEAEELKIIDHPSPKRKTRANRLSTDYILLHTTEGGLRGSLEKNTRLGEANYMIDTNGSTYRIMNPNQISKGAGRSMWDGRTNLDNHAVNIEFVGYHNKKPTKNQLKSGRELISELRESYPGVGESDVMPHSMVAYGASNKWHRNPHRGRKRCGMLFAQEDIRDALGLGKAPRFDPDVKEGRLAVADPYLEGVLYQGNEERSDSQEHADEPEETGKILSVIKKGESARTYAGNTYGDSTTVYFLNDGRVRRGDELRKQGFNFNLIQPGTRVAVGYTYGGNITRNRSAYDVVGRGWNLPSTIYRLPNGEIKTGDDVSANSIPRGTIILFRR